MRLLGLLLGLAVVCSNANAAIILSIAQNAGPFGLGAGPISIDVFARTDGLAGGNTSDVVIADFGLNQGQFSPVAGTIGGAGFLGEGNLQGTSFLGRDPADATNRTVNLSLDFTNPQLFPGADQRIATLNIDTTGLGAGTYNVFIVPGSLATQGGTTSQGVNGSFIISAVPEPTSIALLSVVVGGVFGRRLLRSRKARASVA